MRTRRAKEAQSQDGFEDDTLKNNMIALKKIMFGYVKSKVRKLTTSVLQHGVWLTFDEFDAVNLHFANKPIHNNTINLALVASGTTTPNFAVSRSEVATAITAELNEVMTGLANLDKCTEIRRISNMCGRDTVNTERYFSVGVNDSCINFNYHLGGHKQHQFVLITSYEDSELMTYEPMDSYGVKFLPLSFVSTHSQSRLEAALHRSNLTFSYPVAERIARDSFPALANLKCGSAAIVEKAISDNPRLQKDEGLRSLMMSEVTKTGKQDLASMLQTATFIRRATELGLLPNDEQFQASITNDYNNIIISEIKDIASK